MIPISYSFMAAAICLLWAATRIFCSIRQKRFCCRREAELLLVLICLLVVTRFTFFPFSRLEGKIQPLILDMQCMLPLRINLIPLVHLDDYPTLRDTLRNLIGNIAMFIPIGVIWPAVYQKLNTSGKIIAAGAGLSFCIELLQLPFFDRVSDIDDLMLNTLGYLIGYGIHLLAKRIKSNKKAPA